MNDNNTNTRNITDSSDINGLSRALLSMIPLGEENAIHMDDLANILDVEGRDVRREVLNLRKRGRIIASSQNGYFIPTTNGELLRYYRKARGRALTTLSSLKRTRRVLREMGLNPDGKEDSDNEETI